MDDDWKREEKVTTGDKKLDDFFYDGIGFGRQVLVSGPPFIGKETFLNVFIQGNLERGAPVLIILFDQSPAQQRNELKYIVPDIESYEKDGQLQFIDAYSKSASLKNIEEGQNIVHIDDPMNLYAIQEAIRKVDRPFMQLVVRSVTDCLCFTDQTETLKFLRNITGWAREEKRVGLYDIDKGSHNDLEYNNVVRMMDDIIEFHEDGGKNFLQIKGYSDVHRRDGVEYKFSKRGLKLGSFTLTHVGTIE